MHEFLWNVFAMTGDVDAYLLYKQAEQIKGLEEPAADGVPIVEYSAE